MKTKMGERKKRQQQGMWGRKVWKNRQKESKMKE